MSKKEIFLTFEFVNVFFKSKNQKMKKLIIIPCLLFCVSIFSQDTKWVYCELVGAQKPFSNKTIVTVDYGKTSKWNADKRIKGDDGKTKKFNSMVDAMNYMGEDGWTFLQAYVITAGGQNVYRWLLKKEVPKE